MALKPFLLPLTLLGYELFLFSSLPLPATAKHCPLSLLFPRHQVESSSANAQIWCDPAIEIYRVSKSLRPPWQAPGELPRQTSQGELERELG